MSGIPKIIHYCWFGGKELPKSAKKCIKSWRKYCPDYEIIEWNESNFDINACQYAKEAYEAKKWAFVSDYARFKILYENGGLYFDTDVEIIKPLEDIIERGNFMGNENDASLTVGVNPGLGLGVTSGHHIYEEMLKLYGTLRFINDDGTQNLRTIVEYTTDILLKNGLKNTNEIQCVEGIYIYPKDYFSPKDPVFKTVTLTENTHTIHHFDGTWVPRNKKIKTKIQFLLGSKLTMLFVKIKQQIKKLGKKK